MTMLLLIAGRACNELASARLAASAITNENNADTDAADDGVEQLVLAVDLKDFAVRGQHAEPDHLAGKAALLPAVLAVDIRRDGAGDRRMRLGRA